MNGRYYLFAAEGGTVVRPRRDGRRAAPIPFGPFEPSPRNPILTPPRAARASDPGDRPRRSGRARRRQHVGGVPRHPPAKRPPPPPRPRDVPRARARCDGDGWPTIGDGGQRRAPRCRRPPCRRTRFPRPPARDDFDGGRSRPRWIFVRNPPRATIVARRAPRAPPSLRGTAGHARRGRRARVRRPAAAALRRPLPRAARLRAAPAGRGGGPHRARARGGPRRRRGPPRRRRAARRSPSRAPGGAPRVLGRAALPAGPGAASRSPATADAYELTAGAARLELARRGCRRARSRPRASPAGGTMHFTGAVIGLYATGRGRRGGARRRTSTGSNTVLCPQTIGVTFRVPKRKGEDLMTKTQHALTATLLLATAGTAVARRPKPAARGRRPWPPRRPPSRAAPARAGPGRQAGRQAAGRPARPAPARQAGRAPRPRARRAARGRRRAARRRPSPPPRRSSRRS